MDEEGDLTLSRVLQRSDLPDQDLRVACDAATEARDDLRERERHVIARQACLPVF